MPDRDPPPSAGQRVLAVLGQAVWRHRGRAAAALLFLAISKLAFVAVPLLLKRIVDFFSEAPPEVALPTFLLIAYAMVRLAGAVFGELRDLVFARVTQRTLSSFMQRTFEHLHSLGPRFHVLRNTGGLIRDVERGTQGVGYLLGVALFNIVPTLVEIAAVLAVMLGSYAGAFALIILATLVSYISVTILLVRPRVARQRVVNEIEARANGRLVDSLINHETVRANANEAFESQRLSELLEQRTENAVGSQKALSTLHIAQSAVIACGVGAVMLHAGSEVLAGRLTVGDLVLINAYVIQVCLPLNTLGFVFREARDALLNVERLMIVLDQRPDVVEPAGTPALRVAGGEVRFENIDFGYDASRQILYEVDFRIAPGGTLAVVGGSGSGKSTLARLLLRFYEPDRGRILIDGQDIRHTTLGSLRHCIGLVPQDAVLFNDSVAYNIAYGRIGASMSEVVEAARAAHVHEFIANLPEGYETRVGERGLKLSGGEKQRIAIARAILKNPPLLIFDEATSALDTRAERAIQQELDRISQDRSTLIIAHRLSTIVNADEILVLERGRVVARGRHAQLLAQGGIYAQMWALQERQSELEQEEHRLTLQAVNLVTLAAGVIDGLRPAIEEKRLRLFTSLDVENARVTGDPSRLQRAIWDLLANAINVSASGGRVELTVERAGSVARLSVADAREGNGDPESPHPSVGAPLDPLRLRSVVEQHQGRLEVQRTPGAPGTRYVVELPLRTVATTSGPMPAAPDGPASLDGLTVVVVDDQADAREALEALLQCHGARCRVFETGPPLLAWLEEAAIEDWPDAVVCDISLGEGPDSLDGYEVIRRIRALEARRRTALAERLPAIALSGYARSGDRTRALLSGFQIHLAKPVDAAELVGTLSALTRSGAGR